MAGFQSGTSTTDQLFALRQTCNEFNITKRHLFIDFEAAYDTIIRNEVYVGMSELNFPWSQIQWKEKSRKTEIQVGGWGEQR
jgi:hypothetical protein